MSRAGDLISIIMGVYNNETTIRSAICSIINQTYPDWELIICDDGSTDGSFQAVQEFMDPRIVVFKNDRNHGLSYSLNRCLERAQGVYIARMDADDLSMPDRLARELAFLRENPEYAVVSCEYITFDDRQESIYTKAVIENPEPRDYIIGNPVVHAACMMKRECLEAAGRYREGEEVLRVEDIDLWIRMLSKGYRFYNLQEPLYKVRFNKKMMKRQRLRYRWKAAVVGYRGCSLLGLPARYRLLAFRTVAIGLIPAFLRYRLHILWRR